METTKKQYKLVKDFLNTENSGKLFFGKVIKEFVSELKNVLGEKMLDIKTTHYVSAEDADGLFVNFTQVMKIENPDDIEEITNIVSDVMYEKTFKIVKDGTNMPIVLDLSNYDCVIVEDDVYLWYEGTFDVIFPGKVSAN